ncbi:MAG: family containing protein [Bacilli bacterium]|nr:family containing protein [Bacilli bacterium]
MIYELRIYHMHPGKMEAIHKRFSEVTIRLFEKHGMPVYDFWEDIDGNLRLYYVLVHNDRESRDRNYAAFRNDPDWVIAKNQSEADGPIVVKVENFFMKRVPYVTGR